MEADAYMMTRIPTEKFSILWTVDQFSNFVLGEYDSVRSAKFYPPGAEKLGFMLELKRDTENAERILLVWQLNDIQEEEQRAELKVRIRFKLFINDTEQWNTEDELLIVNVHETGLVFSIPVMGIDDLEEGVQNVENRISAKNPPEAVAIRFEMKMYNSPIRYGVASTARGYTHYTQLIDDLQRIYENQEFADCVIVADGQEFYASRAVLAARSPVFKTMFTGNFEEAKTFRAEFPDISAEVMRKLLDYLYMGCIDEMDECADELLEAGHRFQVEGVQMLAAEALAKEIDVENVCQLLARADLYGAHLLKTQCSSFFARHRHNVIKTDAWKTLIAEKNSRLLAELLEGAAEFEDS